tara:strand:+ start:247 stop:510 length:264 start_codon:yes stop_codon:yes gene_type:complete
MKVNKTISLTQEAFKQAQQIENFSGWVSNRLVNRGLEEIMELRIDALHRRQAAWLKIMHSDGIDCRDYTLGDCDACKRYHTENIHMQ